jgi:hypothetical protein
VADGAKASDAFRSAEAVKIQVTQRTSMGGIEICVTMNDESSARDPPVGSRLKTQFVNRKLAP